MYSNNDTVISEEELKYRYMETSSFKNSFWKGNFCEYTQLCVHGPLTITSNEYTFPSNDTFLQDYLGILKRMLQIY